MSSRTPARMPGRSPGVVSNRSSAAKVSEDGAARQQSATVSRPESTANVEQLESQLASSIQESAALRAQARNLAEKAIVEKTASVVLQRSLSREHSELEQAKSELAHLRKSLQAANDRIADLSSPVLMAQNVVQVAKVQDAVRRTRLCATQLREAVAGAAADFTAWQRDELANLARLRASRTGLSSVGVTSAPSSGLQSPSAWMAVGSDSLVDPEGWGGSGGTKADPHVSSLLRERTDLRARLAGLHADLAAERAARTAAEARARTLENLALSSQGSGGPQGEGAIPTSLVFKMSDALAAMDRRQASGGPGSPAAQGESMASAVSSLKEQLAVRGAQVAALKAELAALKGERMGAAIDELKGVDRRVSFASPGFKAGDSSGSSGSPSKQAQEQQEVDDVVGSLRAAHERALAGLRVEFEERAAQVQKAAEDSGAELRWQMRQLQDSLAASASIQDDLRSSLSACTASLSREREVHDKEMARLRAQLAGPSSSQQQDSANVAVNLFPSEEEAPILISSPPRLGQGAAIERPASVNERSPLRSSPTKPAVIVDGEAGSLSQIVGLAVVGDMTGSAFTGLSHPPPLQGEGVHEGGATAQQHGQEGAMTADAASTAGVARTAQEAQLVLQARMARLEADVAIARAEAVQASAAAAGREAAWQQAALQHAMVWQSQLIQAKAQVEEMGRRADAQASEAADALQVAQEKLAAAREHAQHCNQALQKAEHDKYAVARARDTATADNVRYTSELAMLQSALAQREETIEQLRTALAPLSAREGREQQLMAQLKDSQHVVTALSAQVHSLQQGSLARDLALTAKDGDILRMTSTIPEHVEQVTAEVQLQVGKLRDEALQAKAETRAAERALAEANARAAAADAELARVKGAAAHLQRLATAGQFMSKGTGRPDVLLDDVTSTLLASTVRAATPSKSKALAQSEALVPMPAGTPGAALGLMSPGDIKQRIRARSANPVAYTPVHTGRRGEFDLSSLNAGTPALPAATISLSQAQLLTGLGRAASDAQGTPGGTLVDHSVPASGEEKAAGSMQLDDLRSKTPSKTPGRAPGAGGSATVVEKRPGTPGRTSYRSLSSAAVAKGRSTESYSKEAGGAAGKSKEHSFSETALATGRKPADVARKLKGSVRVPRRVAARWSIASIVLGRVVEAHRAAMGKAALVQLRANVTACKLDEARQELFKLETHMLGQHIPTPALEAEAEALRGRVEVLTVQAKEESKAHAATKRQLEDVTVELKQSRVQCEAQVRLREDLTARLASESSALARAREETKRTYEALGETEKERIAVEEQLAKALARLDQLAHVEAEASQARARLQAEQAEAHKLAQAVTQLAEERELLIGMADLLRRWEITTAEGAGGLPPLASEIYHGTCDLPADYAMLRETILSVAQDVRARTASIASLQQALSSAGDALLTAQAGQTAAQSECSKLRGTLDAALMAGRESEGLRREVEHAVQEMLGAVREKEEALAAMAQAQTSAEEAQERAERMRLELDHAIGRAVSLASAKAGLEAELLRLRSGGREERQVSVSAPVLPPAKPLSTRPNTSRPSSPEQQQEAAALPRPALAGGPAASGGSTALRGEELSSPSAPYYTSRSFLQGLAAVRASMDEVQAGLTREAHAPLPAPVSVPLAASAGGEPQAYSLPVQEVAPAAQAQKSVPSTPGITVAGTAGPSGPSRPALAAESATPQRAAPPPPPFASPFSARPGGFKPANVPARAPTVRPLASAQPGGY